MKINANCPMIGLLSSLVAILLIAAKLIIPVAILSLMLNLSLSCAFYILLILTLILSCIPTKNYQKIFVLKE